MIRLPREYEPPGEPMLNVRELTGENLLAADAIGRNLGEMRRYASDFGSAIALFEYAHTEDRKIFDRIEQYVDEGNSPFDLQFSRWKWMAARDGAMSLYHFGWAMGAIGPLFKRATKLRELVDHKALREARKRFRVSFPNAENIRHSVAHSAQKFDSPEQTQQNAYRPMETDDLGVARVEGSGLPNVLVVGHVLKGNTYISTFEGGLLAYRLALESLEELNEIARLFYGGFAMIDLRHPRAR